MIHEFIRDDGDIAGFPFLVIGMMPNALGWVVANGDRIANWTVIVIGLALNAGSLWYRHLARRDRLRELATKSEPKGK